MTFFKALDSDIRWSTPRTKPEDFDFKELVCENYGVSDNGVSYDLIFAFDCDDRRSGILFIGKYNEDQP